MTVAAPPSPYKGLTPFEDSDLDALLFFGRERESEVIAANLMAARVTVLYGPSGVGKTSVLRAGVAHRLRREKEVAVVVFSSWPDDPVPALIAAVDGSGDSLVDAVADAADRAGGDLYLILDQFEEYFLYHQEEDAFVRALAQVTRRAGLRVNILIGIREEALAQLDAFKAAIPNLLSNRLRLDRLDRAAGEAAIVRPLDRYNELAAEGGAVAIEAELVTAVLDQVAAGRVELGPKLRGLAADGAESGRVEAPYLQLVMARLWEVETARGSRVLRRATLAELGGAAQIVEDHLEHAMAELSARQKDVAAAMYRFLVTPSGTKIAYDVRDLAGYAEVDEDEAKEVLLQLSAERIVRSDSDNGASSRYEIYHDVLAEAVAAWRSRYGAEHALREAERRRRRAFEVAAAALVCLLLVAAIAVYALVERGDARTQARRAQAEALAAESLTQLGLDPSRSLRLAYDAARLRPGLREETVLRTALLADRLRRVVRIGGAVTAVGYDTNGRRMFAGGTNGAVHVPPLVPLTHGPPVDTAALSRDGSILLVGRGDGSLVIVRRGVSTLTTFGGPVRSVAFTADGRRFVAATNKGISMWRTDDLKPFATFPLPHRHALVKVVVAPDGRQAVAQLRFRRADVYALPSGRRMFGLTHRGFLEDAAYSPDGRFIVTGGYDGEIGGVRLWDARTGRLVREYKGALRQVNDVTFSRDGKLIGAASADGTARVWEARTGTETAIMIGHQNEVTSVDFNPAGTALVSGSSDGTARVWGASGGKAGRLLNVLAGHAAPVTAAVFSPDGRSVLTGGQDGTARVWDPGSEPALTRTQKTDRDVSPRNRTSALSPRRDRRARGLLDGTVRVTDARSGRVLWSRRSHSGAVNSVAFSRDGKLLASASVDHDALVWDVKTGRIVRRLHGHFGPVTDAEFSPDGRWVVTAGPITAGLWLVRSNAPPIFLEAPVSRPLSGVAFTGRDGRVVVAGSFDGTRLRYRCDICGNIQELVALARRRLAAER